MAERAPRDFAVPSGERIQPGGQGRLHRLACLRDEHLAKRDMRIAHNAVGDIREVQGQLRLARRARYVRRRWHVIAEADNGGRADLPQQWMHAVGHQRLWCRPAGQAARTGQDRDDVVVADADQAAQRGPGKDFSNGIRHALCPGRVLHLARID